MSTTHRYDHDVGYRLRLVCEKKSFFGITFIIILLIVVVIAVDCDTRSVARFEKRTQLSWSFLGKNLVRK